MTAPLKTLLMSALVTGGWAGSPVWSEPAEPSVTKVAVLGEGKTLALADLLMVELAKSTGCQMVERAELARLAEEAGVQQLGAAERPVALARLARADALVFLEIREPEPGKPGVAVRLVAAEDGYIRQTVWLPDEADVATNARLAAARLLGHLTSVKRGAAGKGEDGGAVPVSLLGIRAEVPDPALLDLETNVNALLSHRLAAYPGMVVLERWRMDDLVFEKTLDKERTARFPSGAKLISGSMKMEGDAVKVRLVVRRSESEPGTVTALEGRASRLPDLVEKLAGQIAGVSPASSGKWQPLEEARTFGELGEWLLQHGLPMQAAQAFESAVALGDRRTVALMARAYAYSMCAYPDDLRSTYPVESGSTPGKLKPAAMAYHLGTAARAVHAAADIVHLEVDPQDPKRPGAENPPILARQIFRATLRTLRTAHELNLHLRHEALVSALRTAMQRLVKVLDATRMGNDTFYHLTRATYAAYWCATPAETLACYREIFAPGFGEGKSNPFKDGWDRVARRAFFSDFQRHGPLLDVPPSPPPVFPPSQRGVERLIDWQAADAARVLPLWRNFIASLKASASPRDQADGLAFEMKAHHLPASRLRDLEAVAALFWRHRATLTSAEGTVMLASVKPDFVTLGVPPAEMAPALRSVLGLLQDLFEKETWIPRDWVQGVEWMTSGTAKMTVKPEEVNRLLAAMDGYRERTKGDARWQEVDSLRNQPMAIIFEGARKKLQGAWPMEGKASASDAIGPPPFVVSRLWHPARHAPKEGYRGALSGYMLSTSGGKMWVSNQETGLMSVDDRTLATTVWGNWSRAFYGSFYDVVALPDRIYAVNQNGVWWRRPDQPDWSKLPLPDATYQLHSLVNGVGISYGNEPNFRSHLRNGAGVGLVDADQVRWVASTRRRPAEHSLDEAPVKEMIGVFPGTRGEPWVVWNQDILQAVAHPLNARLVTGMKFTHWLQVIPGGDRTLLFETFQQKGESQKVAQVWNLRPDRDTPELLMFDPAVSQIPAETPAVWPLPEILCDNGPRRNLSFRPVLRGESLWILKTEKEDYRDVKAAYTLLGFLPGRAKPVTVPLRFELQAEDLALISKSPTLDPYVTTLNPDCGQRNFAAGQHALAISGFNCKGVWLLPWEELEKWVRDHVPEDAAVR